MPQLGTPQVFHHCSKQKKESSREQGFLKKRVGVRVDDRASMEMQRGKMKNQHGLCMGKGFERGCVGPLLVPAVAKIQKRACELSA